MSSPSSSTTPAARRKRPLAKRSCISCREKKARCELPDISVPSSQLPVPDLKRCHRCKVLDIPCVVWDGDRKRKPRPPTQPSQPSQEEQPIPHSSSWDPLSHLAYAAQVIGASETCPTSSSTPTTTTTSSTSSSSNSLSFLLATPSSSSTSQTELLFKPSFTRLASRANTPSSPFADDPPDHASEHAAPSPTLSAATTAVGNPSANHIYTISSSNGLLTVGFSSRQEGNTTADLPLSGPHKGSTSIQRTPPRTWRSVWRMPSVLVDYAAQQPQFSRYLLTRIGSPDRGIEAINIMDTIDRQHCLELRTCLTPYLAWHPHLPPLESVYDQYIRQPNNTTLLLLASMYLVASRHRHSLSSTLMKALSATVDRLATQLILSSTRHVQIIQAFELLLAHEPSLVGTAVSGNEMEQAYRGNGLAGESLLINALSIAKDLGIHTSVSTLQRLLHQPRDNWQQGQLTDALSNASLWISLRLWESHYIFVKPITRVLRDLDELAHDAKCMIAIDQDGNKVQESPMTVDGISTSSILDHGVETEEKIRSAGRTILAYRIQSMAVVQGSLAKIEDIIKEDVEPVSESLHQGYSRPGSATSIHAKDKIVDVAVQALEEQTRIDQGKQMDMAPFALYHPAALVEEWYQLESSTIFSVLCTFGICALYTGQFDAEFSTRAFIESLRNEKELQEGVGILGKHRLGLSEGLVSSFVFFNRRMTLSTATSSAPHKPSKGLVELTGAPMFLTCALVVDACRLFLEGAAFVLITYTALQQNYDARLLSMVQAAQRLEEFDGNQYEQEEEADRERQENPSNPPLQPLSICQIAAKFIKEVVETLQKWKLASSIYRKTRFSPAMDLRKPFGESSPSSRMRTASASPATTSCSTEDGSTDDNSTPPVAVYPPRPGDGYAHNPLLATQRHPATDTVTASMEHLHTGTGSHAMPQMNAAGWPGYVHPATGVPPTGVPQPHFILPTQFWPMEMDSIRMYGSGENSFAGTTPEQSLNEVDAGGLYDIPLFNSFFDSFLPH